jgi:phosphoglycerol transferase MdoB-like AlkP superfamily enzyme
MLKRLGYYIRRPGYYLSIAFSDIPFAIFFIVLLLKLLLFDHINGLGTLSFSADFGVIVILLSLSIFVKNRKFKLSYLLFLNLVLSLIFFSNSLYRTYFEDFASAHYIEQVPLLLDVADSVLYIMDEKILFFIDFLFLPFLLLKLKTKRAHSIKDKTRAIILLLLLGVFCNLTVLKSMLSGLNYFTFIGERYICVWYTGIINYQIFDAYSYISSKLKKVSVTQSDIDTVYAWFNENKVTSTNDLTGAGHGYNLIIIQLESMQNFIIGKTYQGKEIVPNLNRLAREGIYFNNIYDQTYAGSSSDATLLANSSLYPAREGAASFQYAKNCFDSFPKILREHGYMTVVMHPHVKSFWNSEIFEKHIGFEQQFYKKDFDIVDTVGLGLSDREFFSQSLKKIKKLNPPFYVFMRTLTAHFPYDYVKEERDDFPLGDMEGEITGHYFRTMHYVDSAIGEFLYELAEINLASKTIIVIYSDHRARLPEEELQRIGIDYAVEHRKIPLIIYIPNRNYGIERDTIGGLIDVAPTICNMLGIDSSDNLFLGRDLMDKSQGFVFFRDGSFKTKDDEMSNVLVQEQLMISDVILEKDLAPYIRKGIICN